tara:strand:- start:226 stop:420 length:195 start_codon:yes stop_codon:yes gene_type:complete
MGKFKILDTLIREGKIEDVASFLTAQGVENPIKKAVDYVVEYERDIRDGMNAPHGSAMEEYDDR